MHVAHIIHTSLSLAIIYGSYVITTEYLTNIYKDVGIYAYVILFMSNVIFSILAPFIVYHLTGIKISLIIGAAGYIVWILLFNINNNILILIGSGIIGSGAGILRSQQNVWISSLQYDSIELKDYYVGIYNTIFSLNGIMGSIFTTIILVADIKFNILIWILLALSTISLFSLSFIKSIELNDTHKILAKDYCKMFIDKKMLLLIPLIFAQAIGLAITYEIIPLLIVTKINVSYMFLSYSFTYSAVSYSLSFLIKYVNPIFMLILSIIMHALTSITIFMIELHNINQVYYSIIAISIGITDSLLSFVILYIIHTYFQSKVYYSIYRAYICTFSAIFTLVIPLISTPNSLFVMMLSLLIGVLFYIFFIYKVSHKKVEIP